jgi:hypothetical protein
MADPKHERDARDEANAARHADAARQANETGQHPTSQARPSTALVPPPDDAPPVLALRSAPNDLADAAALDQAPPPGEEPATVAVTFGTQYLSYYPGETAQFTPAQAARLNELGVTGAAPPPRQRTGAKPAEDKSRG